MHPPLTVLRKDHVTMSKSNVKNKHYIASTLVKKRVSDANAQSNLERVRAEHSSQLRLEKSYSALEQQSQIETSGNASRNNKNYRQFNTVDYNLLESSDLNKIEKGLISREKSPKFTNAGSKLSPEMSQKMAANNFAH